MIEDKVASAAWIQQLEKVRSSGKEVGPRGKMTLEVPSCMMHVSMRYPIVGYMERGLSYQFMAAEALWIVMGSNSLKVDNQIALKLRQFSDDGHTLSGAYGPPFVDQTSYVVQKILEDRDTRQAVMTIWRPRPYPSKDIPCTVALQFLVRDNVLNSNVFMRSSDVWLGIPYDIFSFTIMSTIVALRSQVKNLGTLTIFTGSSHLYQENWERTDNLLRLAGDGNISALSGMPLILENTSESSLINLLGVVGSQKSNREAMKVLMDWGDLI